MFNSNQSLAVYHAKPEFVLRGHDYCVVAAAQVSAAKSASFDLAWSAGEADGRVCMSELSVGGGMGYSLVSATIPASALAGVDSVKYRFFSGGSSSEEYAVAVADEGLLPPLIITEFYARPKGLSLTSFIEIMNPTEEPVDLYDYKMIVVPGDDPEAKAIITLDLADKKGQHIIAPRSLALLWPQYPKHHEPEYEKYSTPEGFCELLNSELPPPMFKVSPEEIQLIKLEFCRYDEELASYVYKEGARALPAKIERTTLFFAPRSGSASDAIYSMTYNEDDGCNRSTPVRHSSLWQVDVREPLRGVMTKNRVRPTPGELSHGQGFPDTATGYPALVPLMAGKSISASQGGEGDGLRIEFEVVSGNVCGVEVSLKTADGGFIERDAKAGEGGRYTVEFPVEVTDRLEVLEYFVTIFDGVRKSSLGSSSAPLVTNIDDDKGPTILSLMPPKGFAYDGNRTPEISVEYFDVSGVDTGRSLLYVDGKNVTQKADWGAERVSYTPSSPMRRGRHKFEIILVDTLENETRHGVSFSICRKDELNLYRGEVHSHTADSDGIAGPEEAITYARDVGQVDFFSVTEHSHYMAHDVYAEQIKCADKYDEPGKFAVLYGWEMTWNASTGLWGHMNILNTKWIVNDINENSLPDIYRRIADDRGAVAMFNHPGLAWGNFLNYSYYTPEVDRNICLSEIKSAGYDREYVNMLSLGWHASPVFNEDNHSFNWTTGSKSTTYVLAPALTRENILDAFRRRRTYSTSDPTMKIYFKINGEWMGSRLISPEKLNVDIKITTESERGIGNISLVTEDNIIVSSINVGALREYHWKLKLPPEFDYYYVKVTSQGQYTVTAPIWLEEESGGKQPLNINKISFSIGEDDYKPNVMTAEISNDGKNSLRELVADFYLTHPSGIDLRSTAPYASISLPDLPVGESVNVSCSFPNLAGMRRATVIVGGVSARRRCCDTAAGMLTPLRISEICAETSPAEGSEGNMIKNPFPYVKIYNASNRDVLLDGYYTRHWVSTGKAPLEDRMLKLDGLSLPAGQTLTLWRRPKDSALTAADFNERYGTSLVEGEGLVVSEIPFISSSPDARRLELMCGNETLSRIEYNFGARLGKDVVADKAIFFDNHPSFIGTSKIVEK